MGENVDWASVVHEEAQRSPILRTDELSRKYEIVPAAVTQALSRQERRGIVEHVSRKTYFNRLALNASPRDLVNVLRSEAYISLESALLDSGVSTQSPYALTCVTTQRAGNFEGKTVRISYRTISPRLYWGYVKKSTRYGSYLIAEPEKAILDLIYLSLQQGVAPALDELDFDRADKRKLLDYAPKFPSTVMKELLPALAMHGVQDEAMSSRSIVQEEK